MALPTRVTLSAVGYSDRDKSIESVLSWTRRTCYLLVRTSHDLAYRMPAMENADRRVMVDLAISDTQTLTM